MKTKLAKLIGFVMMILAIVGPGCTMIPVDERAGVRADVSEMAKETIDQLSALDPSIESAIADSAGFFTGRVGATKLPLLGGGYGLGVAYDKVAATRTYLNITRFDLGAGLGAGTYRLLVIFDTREALEKFVRNGWQSMAGAESRLGQRGSSGLIGLGTGVSAYVMAESGTVLTATARLIRLSVNADLTNTGVADVTIPSTGLERPGEQIEDAPRRWDRRLPFLAQKVIDEGYDLPLPYGIGITYADVDQEQVFTSLEVGINGRDRRPVEFVDFENARSLSRSASLKLDAWLFPFMNVYAMLGQLDGRAPVDVIVDGNGFLEALEVNCNRPPPSPLCPLLQDNFYTLPINARFNGNTYGVGMTLAGGWNGWFVTIPFNWTYADMEGSETDGTSFTATPRGGYLFNLGRAGTIAGFVGGNYLNSDLTVDGIATAPGTNLTFDYVIDQKNKDEWNAVVGFNWDVNRNLSWSLEYNGFIGSRTAWISSLVWRY
jgi:hypothetical protein